MAQEIKNASIFGRVGSAIGKGLAEQAPKEIDRFRLANGLRELGQKQGLSPFQQFSELSSIPGVTPQMIHSGSELLKQQGISNELIQKSQQEKKEQQERPNPFEQGGVSSKSNLSPSLTTRTPIDYTLNPYIPKTLEEKQQRAGELFNKNKALYGSNPEKALEAAEMEDITNQKISASQQAKRQSQQDVQNRVETGLKHQESLLGAKVPGNVYSKIEDKAINAVIPKEQGGEGLTEQQAKKKYGNELDAASRDYQDLESLGNRTLLSSSPKEIKNKFKSIREGFKERNDLENLADSYIALNGLSPSKAYYLAYPSSEIKALNNEIVKLPEMNPLKMKGSFKELEDQVNRMNNEAYPKLAKAMGKEGSPLSISEELNAKGYDGQGWLDYLNKNRKELDLTERQARELQKKSNFFPNLNDNWLFLLSGLDELVEQ